MKTLHELEIESKKEFNRKKMGLSVVAAENALNQPFWLTFDEIFSDEISNESSTEDESTFSEPQNKRYRTDGTIKKL